MTSKSKLRFWAIGLTAVMLVVVALFIGRGGGAGHTAEPAAASQAVEVPVSSVIEKTVPLYLSYVGTTDPIRTVVLQAEVTGYLQRQAVQDGADVKKGALLYQIDPRNYQAVLDQAKAQAQKDAAALQYAKANHSRNEAMSKNGDVSIDALQQSESTEQQQNAALAADKAAIETAELNLGYTQIHAPFDGRLSLSLVHEGALISVAGTQLNTLVQLDPIYATFNPPDADLAQIEKYQTKAPIPAEVFVGEGSAAAEYRGKLTFLDNNVGRNTGTITARATIENPIRALLPGQFIRVRLHIADQPDTLLVPQIAVSTNQLGKYVYVVGQDGTVVQRFVTLGADYDPLVVVSKGVAKGETVAVGNLLKIAPGVQVKPVPAQMQTAATLDGQ